MSSSSSPTGETVSGKNFSFELITAENVMASDSKAVSSSTFPSAATSVYRHNQSTRDPTIRHAGRAHIRGKIRRIWRPRYLELCDKGLLRYYELPPTADVTMPEEADWQHVNMVIKDTLVIHHARIIDVTTLRDLHVGLPRGSYGFVFRGQQLFTNELLLTKKPQEPDAPREYFCAVGTLEEAQTWVIALQWAAVMCKKNRIAEKFYFDESGFRSSGETVLTRNTGRSGMSLQCGLSNVPSSTRASLPHGPSLRESDHKTPKKSKSERVLVTKVHGFRVTRDVTIAPAFRWEVAYEIALLLVHKHKIEERRILLTTRDLKELLNDLCERSRDSVLQSFYRQLQDHAQTLPSFHHVSKQNACSAKIVADSVARVDSILRSLAMEPSAVNSRSLKRTLGLDVEQPMVQDISWWKLPKRDVKGDTHVLPSGRVVFRQVRPIPNDINVDEWVRVWLIQTSKNCQMQQATSSSWQMQAKFLVLRRPWFLMSGVGVAAALLYPISQAYQKSMLSLVVRADVLAASWCVAYWYGRRKGVEQAKQQRFAALQASARGIPRISTISPQVVVASPAISSPHRLGTAGLPMSPVASGEEELPAEEFEDSGIDGEDVDSMGEEIGTDDDYNIGKLSSPLPRFSETNESTGWSEPPDPSIFRVRGSSYLEDRIKVPSGPSPFKCRGVDIWMTDNPERHIARHPSVLGGKLQEEDTFLVNFLLPFANFVSYFSVPPLKDFPNKQVADVWTKFLNGDQQYRDARLKLLPVVVEGPWIVKTAVGNGSAPALLGKAIPLQYYFQKPDGKRKGVYEVDVIITASTIAKGILNVVKGHTNSLAIAFALIIEASEKEELPETVLCSFQVHFLNLEDCPMLPTCNLDDTKE